MTDTTPAGPRRLFIGNDSDPNQRPQITVSDKDFEAVLTRLKRPSDPFTVTDLSNGRAVTLRVVACNLPHCYCALEFVQ